MKIRLFNTLKILAATTTLLAYPLPQAQALGDFELWHTEAQQIKLSKKLLLAFQETFRFDKNGVLYHQEYDFGFRRDISQNWDWGFNYRLVYVKNKASELEEESRPQFLIGWKMTRQNFSLQDRNILEYRAYQHKQDSWRYRNKITASGLYFNAGQVLFRPYIADEIFIDMTTWGLVRNRAYAGLYADLASWLTAELYYMRQSTKTGSAWAQANIAGTSLKLTF